MLSPTERAIGSHPEVKASSFATTGVGLRHFVETTFSRRVVASPARCKMVGISSVFIVVMLGEGLPMVVASLGSYCVWNGQNIPLSRSFMIMLPSFVNPLIAGGFISLLLAHSKYYSPKSPLHFCTACYAIVLFAGSFSGPVQVMKSCRPDSIPINLFTWLHLAMWLLGAMAIILQFWQARLKLKLMQAAAPVRTQVGVSFANMGILSALLRFVCEPFLQFQGKAGLEGFLAGSLVSSMLCYIVFLAIFLSVMDISARCALKEAAQHDVDELADSKLRLGARWTRITARMTLMSSLTSIACNSWLLWWSVVTPDLWYFVDSWVRLLDTVLNVFVAALLSGIACPEIIPPEALLCMQNAALSVVAERRRQIESRLRAAIGASMGSALTVAVFMEGVPPEKILADGVERFRCITWETLAQRPEIITGGSPIDGFGPVVSNLYSLSRPCRLGHCDAFYSHSWHDAGVEKWEALKVWSSNFERSHARQPRLWLDKVCLDQANIDVDLRSLPVFLAGCNTLFATSGWTYRSRLWCAMELLVYRMMLASDPRRSPPQVWLLGEDAEDCERQRQEWRTFNVSDTKCFHSKDKDRFLLVVSKYPGGPEGFNVFIRELAEDFETFFPAKPWYNFNERI